MPIDVGRLPKIALFAGLSPEQMLCIAQHTRERNYRADITILNQDDPGETFYVIQRGTLKISTTLPDGKEVFLALLATGDTVGEMSLIDLGGRSADVVTQEETTLLAIDRVAFDKLMNDGSAFPRNLMRILARRLRLANVRIQAHCTLDVYGMVAFQILEFGELYGEKQPDDSILIPIRLTQGDIAELVGASRERVNQVVVAYRKKNIISSDAHFYITIHKPEELKKRLL